VNPLDMLTLLVDPARRPRTLAVVALELVRLAEELARLAAAEMARVGPVLTLLEAEAMARRASALASSAFDVQHWRRLAELEALCAHCGHERGDHLTEEPHTCEHEEDGEDMNQWDCKCPGYAPPGLYAPPAIHRTDPPATLPPTSPDGLEPPRTRVLP
jgi:hypothetical protein